MAKKEVRESVGRMVPEIRVKMIVCGSKTICLINMDGKVYRGVSKCDPGDKYDPQIGYQLAYERAMQKYLNHKLKRKH